MIDTGLLKGDLESLKSKLKFRHSSVDLDYLSELVSKRSNLTRESEELKNKRNERLNTLGEDKSKEIEKRIFLQLIDQNWKTHIQYLEQLRQVIGLRSYGQRDPLIEYKKEAFNLFEELLGKLKNQFLGILINIKIVNNENQKVVNKKQQEQIKKFASGKIGRNEPCPCNSGKKYKHCCGAL